MLNGGHFIRQSTAQPFAPGWMRLLDERGQQMSKMKHHSQEFIAIRWDRLPALVSIEGELSSSIVGLPEFSTKLLDGATYSLMLQA